jgi:hypothetical protein
MKPSDHPEFFRFPAPEGRSRESSIVLAADGRFFHEGEPVTHPGMHQAFASWLQRHPDDGRYILSNGYDWTYLTVEGPARFVRAVRSADGRPELVLFDGLEVPLDPRDLRSDAEGKLSVALARGEPASFTAAAQLQLAPWLEERDGVVGLQIEGDFWPIAGA